MTHILFNRSQILLLAIVSGLTVTFYLANKRLHKAWLESAPVRLEVCIQFRQLWLSIRGFFFTKIQELCALELSY